MAILLIWVTGMFIIKNGQGFNAWTQQGEDSRAVCPRGRQSIMRLPIGFPLSRQIDPGHTRPSWLGLYRSNCVWHLWEAVLFSLSITCSMLASSHMFGELNLYQFQDTKNGGIQVGISGVHPQFLPLCWSSSYLGQSGFSISLISPPGYAHDSSDITSWVEKLHYLLTYYLLSTYTYLF